MTTVQDRIIALRNQSGVTGIDFISVDQNQLGLKVYFLRSPATLTDPLNNNPIPANNLKPEQIEIYNREGAVPPISVTQLTWDGTNEVLQLAVAHEGDFTIYHFKINDQRIDPYFNDVRLDFKAGCPSDLDCEPPAHECAADEIVDIPVDYLARDFWSYRRALLEFASLRYPDWQDRLVPDAGVMITELLSALGDEMAYYQDRVARESYLETATQRRSVRRHASLVDYDIKEACGATAWIDVKATGTGAIPTGTPVWAESDDGTRVNFEFGTGLEDYFSNTQYFVNPALNELDVHQWDEDDVCLPVRSVQLYLNGHHTADFLLGQSLPKWVLLQTDPTNPGQPARRHMVKLIKVSDETDQVFNAPITKLIWEQEQATPFELDMTVLKVHGNLVPATAGSRQEFYMITGASLDELDEPGKSALEQLTQQSTVIQAVERVGPNNSICYLTTLPLTEAIPLTWHKTTGPFKPEIKVFKMDFVSNAWTEGDVWAWKRSLLGIISSDPNSEEYTIEEGSWRRVVGYQREGKDIIHRDYASPLGSTIRFGDGEFGLIPPEKSVFKVYYRIGSGRSGNLAPDALRNVDGSLSGFVASVSNPLNAINGTDAETADEVRQSAPHAFKEITYRAVKPEDYAAAAELLPWVQRAGAALRWTGSWITVFVTPDPLHTDQLNDQWRDELTDQLNRYRQAGRPAFVLDPRYADIDLDIKICVQPDQFKGEVKERVLEKLMGRSGLLPQKGFFSPDYFTFGTLLERSRIEAAIQEVPGVKAVEKICYRVRGKFEMQPFTDFFYDPGIDTIIRVENNPLHPERGTLTLHMNGGS